MQINLTVKAGPHEGAIYEFKERANFVVGRSERAHFRLPIKDKSISRIHFMIELNPPLCRLIDMENTNGTRVNGQKVSIVDLKDGDRITAGKTVLLLSVTGEDEPAVSPTGTFLTPASAGAAWGSSTRRCASRRPARGAQDNSTGRGPFAVGHRPLPPRSADPERAGSSEHRGVPRDGRSIRPPGG